MDCIAPLIGRQPTLQADNTGETARMSSPTGKTPARALEALCGPETVDGPVDIEAEPAHSSALVEVITDTDVLPGSQL